MASTFTFGFSGDDIDADIEADTNYGDDEMQIDTTSRDWQQKEEEPELVAPQKHTLIDILSSLPSNLSYNTLSIPLTHPPASTPIPTYAVQTPTTHLLRRSLFDVIAQLKAEADIAPPTPSVQDADADANASNARGDAGCDYETLISTLESGDDLRSRVYEGGFKTWECGFDLARYLAVALYLGGREEGEEEESEVDGAGRESGVFSRWFGGRGLCGVTTAAAGATAAVGGDRSDGLGGDEEGERQGFDVIELGAGSALPSLVLLNHILSTRMERDGQKQEDREGYVEDIEIGTATTRFILCDYNIEVLRLVTGANVLLQLAQPGSEEGRHLLSGSHDGGNEHDRSAHDSDATGNGNGNSKGEGELDNITPAVLHDSIVPSLTKARICIDFVSGAWGPAFVDLVSPCPNPPTTTNPNPAPKAAAAVAAAAASILQSPRPRPRPTLILSSETIYSPSSLQSFIHTLLSLLQRSRHRDSMALVAAKKMYFGVGGGVDEFTSLVRAQGGLVQGVREINEGGGGVGRVILRVSLPAGDVER